VKINIEKRKSDAPQHVRFGGVTLK